MTPWGERAQGRGHDKGKGPKVGICFVCSRKSRNQCGWSEEGRRQGHWGSWGKIRQKLAGHTKDLDFLLGVKLGASRESGTKKCECIRLNFSKACSSCCVKRRLWGGRRATGGDQLGCYLLCATGLGGSAVGLGQRGGGKQWDPRHI